MPEWERVREAVGLRHLEVHRLWETLTSVSEVGAMESLKGVRHDRPWGLIGWLWLWHKRQMRGPRGCRETSREATAEIWVSHDGVVTQPHLFHAPVTLIPCPEAFVALTGALSPHHTFYHCHYSDPQWLHPAQRGCHANARHKCGHSGTSPTPPTSMSQSCLLSLTLLPCHAQPSVCPSP